MSAFEQRTISEPELIALILSGERQLFHELVRPLMNGLFT